MQRDKSFKSKGPELTEDDVPRPSLALHLRATIILVVLCLLGSFSTLPMLMAARANAGQAYTMGLLPLMGIAALQTLVLFGLAAFLGLRAAAACGLSGAPFIVRCAGGNGPVPVVRSFLIAAGLGIIAGLMVVAADLMVFQAGATRFSMPAFDRSLGLSLLTGVLYGGVNEEVLMRLFLVSGLVYLLVRIFTKDRKMRSWHQWTAIVIAALVFGAAHLPFTSLLTALTPLIILRALVLNGIVGLLCGRLYVLFGVEAAMIAHAAAHLPLQLAVKAFQP
ncbi:CPBP family glutamic-type intramembrane protease [Microvirga rosea]|uniref:CPBP family glutamic-type intramembrane protease n=1 Tax=Microvirga rosea TaxID=2715425 RepID=UPI001D0BD9B8|nr:CPBP family glutamic-type intramembrane protease [Microvirga rosea]MCB8822125.1 CPBP family intramembrane metalloprotease [Microvirga rosea]